MTTSSFDVKRAKAKNVVWRDRNGGCWQASLPILHNAACLIGDQGMDALAEGDVRESLQHRLSSVGR